MSANRGTLSFTVPAHTYAEALSVAEERAREFFGEPGPFTITLSADQETTEHTAASGDVVNFNLGTPQVAVEIRYPGGTP